MSPETKLQPPPPDFDDDAPELTDAEIKELRPVRELFAEYGIPMPKPLEGPKSAKISKTLGKKSS